MCRVMKEAGRARHKGADEKLKMRGETTYV